MRTRLAIATLALAGCSSPPAWAGSYDGELLAERADCGTGEPLSPGAATITAMVVDRGGGRLSLNGACLVDFTVLDAATARMVPTSCETALEDGTPARYTYLEGEMNLDGDEITLEASARIEADGLCDSLRLTFVGLRQ